MAKLRVLSHKDQHKTMAWPNLLKTLAEKKKKNQIHVAVLSANDYNTDYETLNWMQKSFKSVWALLAWTISFFGAIGNWLFVKHSKLGREIKRLRASHLALEKIYTYSPDITKNKSWFDRKLTHILLNFLNAKAVRNRLKLVKKKLRQAILALDKKEITIASLASGSARAVVEVLSELQNNGCSIKFTVILVDASKNAIKYSEKLAKEYGIENSVNWIRVHGMLEDFIKNGNAYPPDIVEMVGIMDYYGQNDNYYQLEALDVVSQIYNIMQERGYLITCNIRDNIERIFMVNILLWKMVYREPEDLAEIALASGFEAEDCEIIYEPLKIHGLLVCRKMPWWPLPKKKPTD
ncbi:hypothetical protein CL633_02635 [bacterium]|nr:hypothetical protein [bacterium]